MKRLLVCALLSAAAPLFLAGCQNLGSGAAVEALAPESEAMIGEMGAAFYLRRPINTSPSTFLAYGERVSVIEPHPLYTSVRDSQGNEGYVSTFALVPQKNCKLGPERVGEVGRVELRLK